MLKNNIFMDKNILIDQLNDLGKYENNQFKKIAYFKAARIINEMGEDEFNIRNDFIDIKGIGEAINKKIIQFKKTGFIEKWKTISGE